MAEYETFDDMGMCVDCLMLIANGETPPEMSEDETDAYLARIENQWPETEGWDIHTACSENCEGWFSWSACDCCGSKLGGERHPMVAMRKVQS